MTAALSDLRGRVVDAALKRLLNAIVPARFYKTSEAAMGTASYETILRSVGPVGPLSHRQAQTAIILAGLMMGIVRQDADGNLSSDF